MEETIHSMVMPRRFSINFSVPRIHLLVSVYVVILDFFALQTEPAQNFGAKFGGLHGMAQTTGAGYMAPLLIY
jgi:hypothetical protein